MSENAFEKTNVNTMSGEGNAIDLVDVMSVMWKHKFVIAACALVMAVLAGVYSQFFTSYTYTANGIIYVSNRSEAIKNLSEITQSDIDTSRSVSDTYRQVFATRSFLKSVSEETGGRFGWKDIKNMLSISSVNETEFLNISVTAGNPADAYEVVNAVIEKAPEKFASIFQGGEIKIADPPEFPEGPNGKGTTRKIALGFIFGLIIGAGACFALYFFDGTIHKSDDITRKYNLTILGELD